MKIDVIPKLIGKRKKDLVLPECVNRQVGKYGEGNGTPLQYSCLEIPRKEEPGRLQSMGSLGVGHD